ncbi:MAG: 4Fe-4S binding protein [Candidatus ainarchaeum sp.]|nr:4Fe-4S binding protein [Candidatus ainarchaeum sp.]
MAELKINKGGVISEPGSTINYKTGEWRTFIPTIDKTKCIACGKCWANCPDSAIRKTSDGKFEINKDYCKGCLICEKECPVKAITSKVEEK